MRLNRVLIDMIPYKFFFPDIICLCKTSLDIAKMMVNMSVNIPLIPIMKLGSMVFDSFYGIKNCRELLVFNINKT